MANLKEIRNRIASVSSTMQITGAMKVVSAAKLKKAQDKIHALLPYSEKTNEIIRQLVAASTGSDIKSPYMESRPAERIMLVAITSNRGLCGVFNSNIVKAVNSYVKANASSQISLVTIGKRGNAILKKTFDIVENKITVLDRPNFERTTDIARFLMDSYCQKKNDKVVLLYNHFKNAATQTVVIEQFLPLQPPENVSNSMDYILEPNKEDLLKSLLPKSLKIKFYKAICDSLAAEHGARMTAMHKATDNASDLTSGLKLIYNKERQAAITSEILDIVGGAEALGG